MERSFNKQAEHSGVWSASTHPGQYEQAILNKDFQACLQLKI